MYACMHDYMRLYTYVNTNNSVCLSKLHGWISQTGICAVQQISGLMSPVERSSQMLCHISDRRALLEPV